MWSLSEMYKSLNSIGQNKKISSSLKRHGLELDTWFEVLSSRPLPNGINHGFLVKISRTQGVSLFHRDLFRKSLKIFLPETLKPRVTKFGV